MSAGSDQEGFTIIEVLVAAWLAIMVIGATAVVFAQGNASSLAAQRQSEMIGVADQQIENIRQQVKTGSGGFSALAMSTAPAAGSNTTLAASSSTYLDPNHFVASSTGCGASNEGYTIENNWDNTSEGTPASLASWSGCPTGVEPLVIQSGGTVTPKRTGVPVGSDTATIYSYVTDTYVGCSSSLGSCSSATGDARRVVVAVVLSSSTGRNDIGQVSPVYVSTIIANPVPSNQVNSSIGLTLGANIG